ncbi:hypothetical protein O181_043828 [Austropuccinia psidii MF-1]|uniref:Uncharacterized protein n=1 Tax=Austropuccinia psidii MF-1 TaxID=1389203 RepID=A0A9Q3HG33_9BASI|nr:hypothetical protein [Austropuccinia psidii MF-1]
MLYSLVIQQPDPFFKQYHPAIRPRGIPCVCSSTKTDACDACKQAHKKFSFVVPPFRPCSQRSSQPRHPCKDYFVINDDESIPKREWMQGPQTGRQEQFQTISPHPSSIDLSTPPPRPPSNGHFTPRPERSDYTANEGWQWQEEIPAWADCHYALSPMGFKCQKPSRMDEPPIPGPIPSSKPYEDVPNCEPEPEVAPTQSMEEPFAFPTPPHSVITIENMPIRSASLHSYPGSLPSTPRTPPPPPLIPTITLARNLPTYNQP